MPIKITSFAFNVIKLDSPLQDDEFIFVEDDDINNNKKEDYQINFLFNNEHEFEIIVSIDSIYELLNLFSKNEFTLEQTNKSSCFVTSYIKFSPKVIEIASCSLVSLMKLKFFNNKIVERKILDSIHNLRKKYSFPLLPIIQEEIDEE